MVLGLSGVLVRGVLQLHGRRAARISQKIDSRRALGHRFSMENRYENRWNMGCKFACQNCVLAGHDPGSKFGAKVASKQKENWTCQTPGFLTHSNAKLWFLGCWELRKHLKMGLGNNAEGDVILM